MAAGASGRRVDDGGISRPPAVAAALAAVLLVMATAATPAEGFISGKTWQAVRRANRDGGPFVGLVVPNAYEMDPVLQSPSFKKPSNGVPAVLDVQGRRFRFGTIGGQSVVMVMTGLSMLNAGLTTQLLLSLFKVKGIVHWGIAGNANEDLQIGDVTIPEYWAHLSLWNWQRDGDGPENELPLEAAGDYTREYGFLNFSDYTVISGQQGNPGNTHLVPAGGDLPGLRHAGAAPARLLGPRQRPLLRPRRAAGEPGAAGVRERHDHDEDVPAPRAQGDAGAPGVQRQRVHGQRQLPAVHPRPLRLHPRGDGERRRRARGAPARRPLPHHPLALRPGRRRLLAQQRGRHVPRHRGAERRGRHAQVRASPRQRGRRRHGRRHVIVRCYGGEHR
ncbi:hypothetical protein BS78_03G006400 [Paspalum vaginatum]|nr:hypothetical protein BS78_03G006400 [Paspalum vaginatum]KAJ1281867.1 hypothetical protein BS78_03G006400 [Paspalum vaginatum]